MGGEDGSIVSGVFFLRLGFVVVVEERLRDLEGCGGVGGPGAGGGGIGAMKGVCPGFVSIGVSAGCVGRSNGDGSGYGHVMLLRSGWSVKIVEKSWL
jgi:hypothetical protein